MRGRKSNKRRAGLVAAAALVVSAWGGSAAAPAAQAASCKPVGEIYHWDTGYYAISGVRCTAKMHKIAVSGYLTGPDRFYEISKKCKKTRTCFDLSPNFPNPPGRQEWTLQFAAGYKHHWYTVPARYKWFKKRWHF
jgi:hypothetical protein